MAAQEGIGVTLKETEGLLKIKYINPDGAAAALGNVRIDDILVAVNGVLVTSEAHAQERILRSRGKLRVTSLEALISRGGQSMAITLWKASDGECCVKSLLSELSDEAVKMSKKPKPMQRPDTQKPKEGQTAIPHGSLDDFYGGIQKRIGVVSPDFYEQMRREHCELEGHDFHFTPRNYDIPTSPQKEWLLITQGKGIFNEFVYTHDDMKKIEMERKRVRRRIPASWWINYGDEDNRHVLHEDLSPEERCERAFAQLGAKFNLRKEEVVAIILFTGPMYAIYNAVLSNFPPQNAEPFKNVKFTTTIHAIMSAIQKLSQRSPVEEIVYRGLGGSFHLPECFWTPHLQPHLQTPDEIELNVHGYTEFGVMSMTSNLDTALQYSGVLSGLEEKPHPAILAFAAGAVDRGACVKDLSQFPLEVEFTFPPLSYIQPEFLNRRHKGFYVTHPSQPNVAVPVIYVRVNANVRTPTLDEESSLRKKNHIAAFRAQIRDAVAEIRKLCLDRKDELRTRLLRADGSYVSSGLSCLEEEALRQQCLISGTEDERKFAIRIEGFQSAIFNQCEEIFNTHNNQEDHVFLDKFEHVRLVTEMMSVRKWAAAKMRWFIEDATQVLTKILRYDLQKSYLEYVSFCREHIREELKQDVCRAQTRAQSLCQMIGLLPELAFQRPEISGEVARREERPRAEAGEGSEGGTFDKWIVSAIENGACHQDIELMLDTGFFNINGILTASGNSLLSTAVRFGFTETARLLIERKANVNFVNRDGRTPMMMAEGRQHSACVELLVANGAPRIHRRRQEIGLCDSLITPSNNSKVCMTPSIIAIGLEQKRKQHKVLDVRATLLVIKIACLLFE
jgi:hypothetical protein